LHVKAGKLVFEILFLVLVDLDLDFDEAGLLALFDVKEEITLCFEFP
jgi:hypothetical protein